MMDIATTLTTSTDADYLTVKYDYRLGRVHLILDEGPQKVHCYLTPDEARELAGLLDSYADRANTREDP